MWELEKGTLADSLTDSRMHVLISDELTNSGFHSELRPAFAVGR